MARFVQLTLLFLGLCFALDSGFAGPQKAQTIKGWGTLVDPDGDCKIAEDKDKLTITVPNVLHDLTYQADFAKQNGPRVLQETDGDFSLQVCVKAFPRPDMNTSSNGKFSFVGSGLLIWVDAKNFIRLERSAEGDGGGLFVWLERFQDGKSVLQRPTIIDDKDTWLQVERKGNKFSFALKVDKDDKAWKTVETQDVELPKKLQVGVHGINTTTKVFAPQLEELKLNAK
jgi:regulation of enolase protein 1 (concanavalin A-like superfamily)